MAYNSLFTSSAVIFVSFSGSLGLAWTPTTMMHKTSNRSFSIVVLLVELFQIFTACMVKLPLQTDMKCKQLTALLLKPALIYIQMKLNVPLRG